jgi:hypothetical protein
LAVLQLVFSSEDPHGSSFPGGVASIPDHPNPKHPKTDEPAVDEAHPLELPKLTQADLQPVIAALVKSGVARSAIELPTQGQEMKGMEDSHRLVLVKFNCPMPERVEEIVTAMEALGSENKKIDFANSNIAYEIKDCRSIEQAALKNAVKNGQLQVKDLADALGVNWGERMMVMGMPSFDMTASCGNKFMNMGDFSKLLRKLSSESEANVSASSSLYILYEMKKK